ncbi:6-pyruvoyl trahydropterin synthase family protein [Rickettsiales endosymbiont of Stachyamoeba lipophora]|uniref:6-pyruvoyl trahydropterin synthase family protein n=1 Tax=Rickettsiales endosymbiont of Stachyamoeba lipophora TaxID=2486578 RepID=UPI000F64C8C5|nr:6-carboxytetrahydropterin synthase [Rickettsiales endosymbiont of Stachyamoeba lipophora]AZL15388.1 hypothetical protein EF513_02300 [Rickettsiales endosymbiont of Stachyamoeba lipophora]
MNLAKVILSYSSKFSCSLELVNPILNEGEHQLVYGSEDRKYLGEIKFEILAGDNIEQVTGMNINHTILKKAAKQIVEEFNGQNLNEAMEEFKTIPPTLENIAKTIWDKLNQHSDLKDKLKAIKLIDQNNFAVIYSQQESGYDDVAGFMA